MTTSEQISSYSFAEYQLILKPHAELSDQIALLKREFSSNYNIPTYKSSPNLTLVKFSLSEVAEKRLLTQLRSIAMRLPSFKMELRDFGSFPSHTIFIKVQSQEPIKEIQLALREIKSLTNIPDKRPHFLNDPFFSLAFKLPSIIYDKAWLEYKDRSFSGSFIANKLLLLKKGEGDNYYKFQEELFFGNKRVSVKQADLF
jgi:2'-5' RNA ligase